MQDITPPSLHELGWDDTFAAAFAPHQEHSVPGRVSRSDRGGSLVVETVEGRVRARLVARFRSLDLGGSDATALPTVGDWVALGGERIDGQPAVHTLLPRRSAIIRQAPADRSADAQVLAANVDLVLIVVALDKIVNQRRLDRYLALAWRSGTTPVVVLTKADRCDAVPAVVAAVEAGTLAAPVHALSALTGDGVERLDPYLAPGRTAVLLGMSGAGKSTLANRLLGAEVLATREVRADGRGRHATTWRELLRLPGGGLLIDTPGLRELALWDGDEGVAEAFGDIEELAAGCRFADCRHASEPGCAVTAAIAAGVLTGERLDSHNKLQRELAHRARKQDVRLRQADQRRWKQVQRSMRAHYRERGH
ncbi:MAG: ribosome small subunit-dependent GTPase A [Egibacteraceae bacterium]